MTRNDELVRAANDAGWPRLLAIWDHKVIKRLKFRTLTSHGFAAPKESFGAT